MADRYWNTFRHYHAERSYAVFSIIDALRKPDFDYDQVGVHYRDPLTPEQERARHEYNDRCLRIAEVAERVVKQPETSDMTPDEVCKVLTEEIRNAGIALEKPLEHDFIPAEQFDEWAKVFRRARAIGQ